jgi:hypothetical protein
MAYDAARQRVVMYGPSANSWEWDGVDWTPTAIGTPPEVRSATLTYDAVREKVVLFGGYGAASTSNETWELDATGWTKRTLPTSPPGRMAHSATFDGSHVLVFGGAAADGVFFGDLWRYDGATWTELTPAFSPPPRWEAIFAYHAARRRTLMFGADDSWTLGYDAIDPVQGCSFPIDDDGDGAIGCADEDCWGVCTPACSPATPTASCPASPRCGDGTCALVESCRSCPADCPVDESPGCPILCGDFFCDVPEDASTCPGDCM